MVFVRVCTPARTSPLRLINDTVVPTPASSAFDFTGEFVDAIEYEEGPIEEESAGMASSDVEGFSSRMDSDVESNDGLEGECVKSLWKGAGALLDQLEAVMDQGRTARPPSQLSSVSASTIVPNPIPLLSTTAASSPGSSSNNPTSISHDTPTPFLERESSDFSFVETDISDIDIEDLLSVFEELNAEAEVLASSIRAVSVDTPESRIRQALIPPRRNTFTSETPPPDPSPVATMPQTFHFPARKPSTTSLRPPESPPLSRASNSNPFSNPFPLSRRPSGSLPFPSTPFSHRSRPSVDSTASSSSTRSSNSNADSSRWSTSSSSSAATSVADESPSPSCSRRGSASSTRSANAFPTRRKNASEELNYEDFLRELTSGNIAEEEEEVAEPAKTPARSLPRSKGVGTGLSSLVFPSPARSNAVLVR